MTPYPNISLRALEPEDLDLLYLIENDPELWDVSATNVPYSRYLLRDYIAHASGDIFADRQVRQMIENAEGQTVGIVDLVNFDPRHQRAEVGIVIQKKYRRQGYAHDALTALHDYACSILHLHQLYAIVDATNHPAHQLFATAGYRQIAVLPQWLLAQDGYHDAVVMSKGSVAAVQANL